MINAIGIADIKHRAENGGTSNKDCLDLLDYIDDGVCAEDFRDEIIDAVQVAVEDAVSVDSSRIATAVERAILKLSKN